MFTEEEEIKFEILNDGKINVTIIKHYFKNGSKIGEDNWGCCLEPHVAYLQYAETFLDEYHMGIIRATWTDEVMKSYEEKTSQREAEMASLL